jgi:hypothetical protein
MIGFRNSSAFSRVGGRANPPVVLKRKRSPRTHIRPRLLFGFLRICPLFSIFHTSPRQAPFTVIGRSTTLACALTQRVAIAPVPSVAASFRYSGLALRNGYAFERGGSGYRISSIGRLTGSSIGQKKIVGRRRDYRLPMVQTSYGPQPCRHSAALLASIPDSHFPSVQKPPWLAPVSTLPKPLYKRVHPWNGRPVEVQ